jgi:glycosyltransferase involved in cell wall biosynthesis
VSQMTPYLPCYDGFRLIPANLIREFHRRHEIHLISLSDGTEIPGQLQWARAYCRSVITVPARSHGRLKEPLASLSGAMPVALAQATRTLIRQMRPDVAHLEGIALAPLALHTAPRLSTVLSVHDSLSLRYREFAKFAPNKASGLACWARASLARRFERRWLRFADRIVVTSSHDLEALARAAPRESLAVIPNGVDLDYLSYQPRPRTGRMIFTGNMSWLPNGDGAEYFARHVFPLVQREFEAAEFWVAGAEPSRSVRQLANVRGVYVTGTLPDLREWIRSASVYVSPLRFGMGIKNKILEAMALGTPIAATPVSLSGTPLVHGRHLLVGESAQELARAVLRILGDPGFGRSLAMEARRKVEAEYSWASVASRFEEIYRITREARENSFAAGSQ